MENNKAKQQDNVGASGNADDVAKGNLGNSREGIAGYTKSLKLDKWQEEVLNTKGNICLCTGRQVGKTTILSRKAGEYMLNHPKSQIIVVSLTEDQAHLIIIMILTFLEKNHKKLIAKKKKAPTKSTITLTNGSKVISRPVGNTGDAVRGFTGDVLVVDEASRMPEQVWTAAKPTLLTTDGEIWMCSTPFGKQGYFYEAFLNKYGRWTTFHVSSEKVITERPISDSWTEKQRLGGIRLLEEEKKDMGKIAYSQEYLGLFMDDIRRFFSDEWIERVCVSGQRSPNREGTYFLGLDIARMGDDLGTFEIINKVNNDLMVQVYNETTKKKLTTETYDRIIELNRTWDFKQIGIDAGSGSLGVGIMDFLLRESEVNRKVIALNNRKVMLDKYGEHSRGLLKEDMYENLRALGERGYLRLLNDEDLIISLKNIQIEFVMLEGKPTKIKIFGRDSHIVEGLVRAVWLANRKNIKTFIDWV